MKLRGKMFTLFGAALVLNLAFIWFGLTYVLDAVSTRLMKNQARAFTALIQHQIGAEAATESDGDLIPDTMAIFDLAKHVSDETRDFAIRKILLIHPDLHVECAWPASEAGQDYASHGDIRQTFASRQGDVVIETVMTPSGPETDIDVVSWFELPQKQAGPDRQRVLEVKLDFAESTRLLEAQYQLIEFGAIGIASLLLGGLLASLLALISRSAIRPVLRVSAALEYVAHGDLETRLPETGNDEFALLAQRFNEMATGLKEKLRLYQYVSKGTIQAVRQSLSATASDEAHRGRRAELTLFFSDIRGFTSFSEPRDPAEVVATLNTVFAIQADIISRLGGDIDKFVGDEVMAVFENPRTAVAAAIAIQQELERQRPAIAGLHIGIGIHCGTVIQGDVGAATHKDFTVIGDAVNTAARLQSVSLADQILISAAALEAIGPHHDFEVLPHGTLDFKGKGVRLKSYRIGVPAQA